MRQNVNPSALSRHDDIRFEDLMCAWRWLTRVEAECLIAAAGIEHQAEHLADFIRLALNTGCRHNELLRIGDIKHVFKTACARAGIENLRIHDLRHTCAAWFVQAGAALAEVRDVLGHSTVRMTERYAHLTPENTRDALARLDETGSQSGHTTPIQRAKNGG